MVNQSYNYVLYFYTIISSSIFLIITERQSLVSILKLITYKHDWQIEIIWLVLQLQPFIKLFMMVFWFFCCSKDRYRTYIQSTYRSFWHRFNKLPVHIWNIDLGPSASSQSITRKLPTVGYVVVCMYVLCVQAYVRTFLVRYKDNRISHLTSTTKNKDRHAQGRRWWEWTMWTNTDQLKNCIQIIYQRR